MTEEAQGGGHQEGVGKTAGLPGDNADPRTTRLPDDETDDTIAGGDVAAPHQELSDLEEVEGEEPFDE